MQRSRQLPLSAARLDVSKTSWMTMCRHVLSIRDTIMQMGVNQQFKTESSFRLSEFPPKPFPISIFESNNEHTEEGRVLTCVHLCWMRWGVVGSLFLLLLFSRVPKLFSPFSGELTRDYCVTSYRRKMTDTREYPQYFVKKI